MLRNAQAVLILSVIAGMAVDFSFITSQAYFLSILPAAYTLYLNTLSNIFYTVSLMYLHRHKGKFAYLAAIRGVRLH
jgi:hypothetical protein